jgi:hypothetical protein
MFRTGGAGLLLACRASRREVSGGLCKHFEGSEHR